MKIKRFRLTVSLLFLPTIGLYSQDLEINNWSCGVKLKSPVIEVRYFQKENEHNYGFSFVTDSFWKKNPCQLKIGNMSPGGTWSLLKSPGLGYSFSPFFSSKSGCQNLTASLCGVSSFPEEVSYFFQAGYSNSKGIVTNGCVNCWYNPQNEILVASVMGKFKLSKSVKMGFSLTGAYVPYDEHSIYGWFSTGNTFFHEGEMLCGAAEIFCSTKKFQTVGLMNVYSTPYGTLNYVFRSENQFCLNRFIFSLSTFYNPWNSLYLPAGTFISDQLEFRTGIVYKSPVKIKKTVFFKAGFNVYSKINLSDITHPFKINGGIQFSDSAASFTLGSLTGFEVSSSKGNELLNFTSQKITADAVWYLKKITAGISGAWTISSYKESISFTQKYGGKINCGKKIKGECAANWTQTIKEGECKENAVSCGLGLQGAAGWINISGKINLKLDM